MVHISQAQYQISKVKDTLDDDVQIVVSDEDLEEGENLTEEGGSSQNATEESSGTPVQDDAINTEEAMEVDSMEDGAETQQPVLETPHSAEPEVNREADVTTGSDPVSAETDDQPSATISETEIQHAKPCENESQTANEFPTVIQVENNSQNVQEPPTSRLREAFETSPLEPKEPIETFDGGDTQVPKYVPSVFRNIPSRTDFEKSLEKPEIIPEVVNAGVIFSDREVEILCQNPIEKTPGSSTVASQEYPCSVEKEVAGTGHVFRLIPSSNSTVQTKVSPSTVPENAASLKTGSELGASIVITQTPLDNVTLREETETLSTYRLAPQSQRQDLDMEPGETRAENEVLTPDTEVQRTLSHTENNENMPDVVPLAFRQTQPLTVETKQPHTHSVEQKDQKTPEEPHISPEEVENTQETLVDAASTSLWCNPNRKQNETQKNKPIPYRYIPSKEELKKLKEKSPERNNNKSLTENRERLERKILHRNIPVSDDDILEYNLYTHEMDRSLMSGTPVEDEHESTVEFRNREEMEKWLDVASPRDSTIREEADRWLRDAKDAEFVMETQDAVEAKINDNAASSEGRITPGTITPDDIRNIPLPPPPPRPSQPELPPQEPKNLPRTTASDISKDAAEDFSLKRKAGVQMHNYASTSVVSKRAVEEFSDTDDSDSEAAQPEDAVYPPGTSEIEDWQQPMRKMKSPKRSKDKNWRQNEVQRRDGSPEFDVTAERKIWTEKPMAEQDGFERQPSHKEDLFSIQGRMLREEEIISKAPRREESSDQEDDSEREDIITHKSSLTGSDRKTRLEVRKRLNQSASETDEDESSESFTESPPIQGLVFMSHMSLLPDGSIVLCGRMRTWPRKREEWRVARYSTRMDRVFSSTSLRGSPDGMSDVILGGKHCIALAYS